LVGELIALGLVAMIMIASLLRVGILKAVNTEGVTIKTLVFGERQIPWDRVDSPVRISSIPGLTMFDFRFVSAKRNFPKIPISVWVPRKIGKGTLQSAIPTSTIEIREF